jgi:hypothetical protein
MNIAFVKNAVAAALSVGAVVVTGSSVYAMASTHTSHAGIHAGLPGGSAPQSVRAAADAPIDAQALTALGQMAQFFAQAQSLSFSALTTTEDVSSTLQKLQFDTKIRGFIARPNHVYIEKTGAENVSLWFDGAKLVVLDRSTNTYMSVALSGDLDALNAKLDELDIETPFSGLLRSDVQTVVSQYAFQGDFYGPTLVDDDSCNHLAFRQENVDWELWTDVETGAPKKAVITSKMLAGAPQHSIFVQELRINVGMDPSVFSAKLPSGAREAPVAR